MADTPTLLDAANRTLFPNYLQHPVVFEKGRNCRLWDTEGKEYVDFVAGIATCNLGHCHPAVTEALRSQAATLLHVSNWYYSRPQLELAALITETAGMDRVFFCNSGAEASETAIKAARKRSFDRHGPERNLIISLYGAFHGRTMKALTATDPKHHLEAFSPYPDGFAHIEAGDLEGLAKLLPRASALFVEPVQGEGGVRPLDEGFLGRAAALCRQQDVLLILDEVQTGMGRCGSMFAFQALGVEPDMITLAKGLGNGFPIGAVLAGDEIASHMGPGTHGSTFGGNPLACSAALATVRTLLEEDLPGRADAMGRTLRSGLQAMVQTVPCAVEVRGMGLLLGLELDRPAAPAVDMLREKGYLVTAVKEVTLRFTPPLTVHDSDIQGLLAALKETLETLGGSPS